MGSARRADHRMNFVDHDKLEVPKDPIEPLCSIQEQGLDRLRCNQQNTSRTIHESFLAAAINVTMPTMDLNLRVLTQGFQPSELIVDKRFQRSDVDSLYRSFAMRENMRKDRQKCCFGFPRSGSRGNDDVRISGAFTEQTATTLAAALASGALPSDFAVAKA